MKVVVSSKRSTTDLFFIFNQTPVTITVTIARAKFLKYSFPAFLWGATENLTVLGITGKPFDIYVYIFSLSRNV